MSRLINHLGMPIVSQFFVLFYDVILAGLAMRAAVIWRYDFLNEPVVNHIDIVAAFVFAGCCLIVWIGFRVPKAVWRFTSLNDIRVLMQACLLASILAPLFMFLFINRGGDFPRAAPLIAGPLLFGALTLSRAIVMFIKNGDIHGIFYRRQADKPDAILVGSAWSASNYFLSKSRQSKGPGFNILGLVDTEKNHKGRSIRGIPVLGDIHQLPAIYQSALSSERARPTLIATDSNADRSQSSELVKLAADLGAPLVRVEPGLAGPPTPFEAEDLIGRQVRQLDMTPVNRFLKDKCVLITGAGGTIGSELTRQISMLSPQRLVLVDMSEFNLYTIRRQLTEIMLEHATEMWTSYLGDTRDMSRMREIFEATRPDVIFHAAALKHVPIGEHNPLETLRTNICGTQNLLELSREFDTQSFTLISTDKAVEPSSVMGASKRVAEMLTMAAAHKGNGKVQGFSSSAVRFGNVLASTGSVIPLFEEQIARGGPVTVTHKDVNRYFMTTHEAAALVLQAAAVNMGEVETQSSVYVLEMGDPVNIARLARQLIRLRGLVPDEDIDIVYTGLRPGEKLTEVLTGDRENLVPTRIEGILRIGSVMQDPQSVERRIGQLIKSLQARDRASVFRVLNALVPEYQASDADSLG